nr:hypothetical protein [Tanacetum cinerariifolium]
NCPKCGNPVYGHYCHGCALLRKKFKEDLLTSCVENKILQDSSGPSNDNSNVANALREPFVVNLDPVTPSLSIEEPDNSLSMRDEHLDTIPATELDEFIKPSVENLVPIPNFPKKLYSNPLFDEEIIPIKIDPHHFNAESDLIESLLNNDSSIIPSLKIDSLFDEFRLLYDNSSPRLPEEFVFANSDTEIEYFSPSPIPVEDSDSLMKEINLSFTSDYPMPPGIEEDKYDSERDTLILKDLLSNDTLSLPEIKSFHFNIPSFSRPLAKPPDGNTGILNVKMMGDISKQKVPMHGIRTTLVLNQGKSPDHLSHLGHEAF